MIFSGLRILLIILIISVANLVNAQLINDSLEAGQRWNFHFQSTVTAQYHPAFHAKYSGLNSLDHFDESTISVT